MNKSKNMANLSLFFISSIILIVSTLPSTVSAIAHATSTAEKDQVPCTMCAECEDPCQPLPPPPPPVIECPPPPPPPSPPPPLPLPPPPAVSECPPPPPKPTCDPCETLPPPKPPCEDATCLPSLEPPMPWVPQGPPRPPYPPGSYYPPGIPFPHAPDYGDNNDGGQLMPAMRFLNLDSYSVYITLQSLTFVALLFCTSYYLFV